MTDAAEHEAQVRERLATTHRGPYVFGLAMHGHIDAIAYADLALLSATLRAELRRRGRTGPERAAFVFAQRRAGASLDELADTLGVTRERVRQVYNAEYRRRAEAGELTSESEAI
jgi:predicted chitinase